MELCQEASVTTDGTTTAFGCTRTAKMLSNSVQLSNRTGGIKLGKARRGLGHGTADLRLVLNMQPIGFTQHGWDDPDLDISVSDACHEFKIRELVSDRVAICFQW